MITPIQSSVQKSESAAQENSAQENSAQESAASWSQEISLPVKTEETHRNGLRALEDLLTLIGELSLNWSNNESQFIYVIRALLKTDDTAAAIVFATLNTTRSRLDLVSRLARVRLKGSPLHGEVNGIVKDFLARTRFRNELNHATFVEAPSGAISHTLSTKIDERGSTLSFGTKRAMDQKRMDEMVREIAALKSINLRILDVIAKLEGKRT